MAESRLSRIKTLLQSELTPNFLEVIDESHNHHVPQGSESHFKLIIVSAIFDKQSLIERHRSINQLLKVEFDKGMHALALHTYTPTEWQNKKNIAPDSPNCKGGFNK